MSALTEALLRLFYPKHCFLCNRVILPRRHLCADCAQQAPYILPPVCDRCGRGEDVCICGGHRHHYERCVSAFYHDGVAQTGIYTLKSEDLAVTVDGFAAEMAEVVRREYGGIPFDLVTAVPLHPADRRARGFDQAARLGQALAVYLQLPYVPLLKKITRTQPQKTLTAIQRSGNLLGVFDVIGGVEDKTVLLVDDVITTGTTLDECAKMLKIYGAAEVYAVSAAAAVLKKDGE